MMIRKRQLDMTVVRKELLNTRVAHLILTSEETLPQIQGGQFVQIQVPDNGVLLRRPISVHDVDIKNNELHLLIQAIGRGTQSLYNINIGEILNVLLPLGNGFPKIEDRNVLLIGGGIGVAPLLYVGRILSRTNRVDYLLGGRTNSDILRLNEYETIAPVSITTEDGTKGERGFVTNHSILQNKQFDIVMTCGPTPMMKAVANWAKENGIACYASLENMMACGLGACLCCVTKRTDGHNVCVCTEGPVFNTTDINL